MFVLSSHLVCLPSCRTLVARPRKDSVDSRSRTVSWVVTQSLNHARAERHPSRSQHRALPRRPRLQQAGRTRILSESNCHVRLIISALTISRRLSTSFCCRRSSNTDVSRKSGHSRIDGLDEGRTAHERSALLPHRRPCSLKEICPRSAVKRESTREDAFNRSPATSD